MTGSGAAAEFGVVIVNFNAGDALVPCVTSVLSQNVPCTVLVADNDSSDGSAECLQQSLGSARQLTVLRNKENLGFARAVNGAAVKLPETVDYLLILNPDCELLPGSLASLGAALDQDPAAGLAGPVVVDRQGRPMKATLRRFPTPWNSLLTFTGLWRLGRWIPAFEGVDQTADLPAETASAEAVSGACMLIRRALFEEMGGMDARYGLHCEDLDLMYRIGQRGMHCLLVPSARVFHQQGVSSKSRPGWVHWQKHLGMQRFFLKFQASAHSPPVRWLVLSGIWIRFAVTWPLVWLRRGADG